MHNRNLLMGIILLLSVSKAVAADELRGECICTVSTHPRWDYPSIYYSFLKVDLLYVNKVSGKVEKERLTEAPLGSVLSVEEGNEACKLQLRQLKATCSNWNY